MSLKSLIKNGLSHINYFPLRNIYGGYGHILLLHNVLPENQCSLINRRGMEVTPEFLESSIQYFIKNGYSFYSLDDLHINHDLLFENKKFVIYTFDDGYAGCLKYGAPIFEKYQVPYSIYLCTQMIENKLVLWWYLLEEIITKNDFIEFQNRDRKFKYNTGSLKEKYNTFFKIRELFVKANNDEIEDLFNNIFSGYTDDFYKLGKKYSLTWDEVKQMSKNKLITFGAHTLNHYNLARLSYDAVFSEIAESKHILEQKTGKPVEHFAYPFGGVGQFSNREIKLVENLGFKTAVTSIEGNFRQKSKNQMFALPRIIIFKATIEELDFKINGGYALNIQFFSTGAYSG
jgi:peptidoglycan/xylan/chitin deacetylase (PgdA/CDA1 family)